MKIKQVTDEAVIFDNGNTITFDHCQDCCEYNYADFSILNENVVNYNYDFKENLKFRAVEGMGFKFGSDGRWIFIPCYSEQNGYYTEEIDIYYNGKQVLNFNAEFVDCQPLLTLRVAKFDGALSLVSAPNFACQQ